ncbi:MAG: hypothetical protein PHV32_07240 [Eubacteriales bacterium]|nr:hypothetical protein [Kiritimatiellia bacterium]MDD4494130.1 hypothetical protein [Eubacteriales bacterium]
MDTRQVAKDVRLAHWAELLRERRDSGLSVRCYCEEQGINEKTYYYWQHRLRETACERLTSHEQSIPESPHNEMATFAALPVSSCKNSGNIVIHLNGTEVEIHSGADPAAIDAVLRVLRGC